jgi:hypothetical protein
MIYREVVGSKICRATVEQSFTSALDGNHVQRLSNDHLTLLTVVISTLIALLPGSFDLRRNSTGGT